MNLNTVIFFWTFFGDIVKWCCVKTTEKKNGHKMSFDYLFYFLQLLVINRRDRKKDLTCVPAHVPQWRPLEGQCLHWCCNCDEADTSQPRETDPESHTACWLLHICPSCERQTVCQIIYLQPFGSIHSDTDCIINNCHILIIFICKWEFCADNLKKRTSFPFLWLEIYFSIRTEKVVKRHLGT